MNELPQPGDVVTYIDGGEFQGEVDRHWLNRQGVVLETRPTGINNVRVRSNGFVEWYPHTQLVEGRKEDLSRWKGKPIKEMGDKELIIALGEIYKYKQLGQDHPQKYKQISLRKALMKKLGVEEGK